MSITVGLRVAVHSQLPWQALTTSSNLLLQVDTPLDWSVEVNCHSLAAINQIYAYVPLSWGPPPVPDAEFHGGFDPRRYTSQSLP